MSKRLVRRDASAPFFASATAAVSASSSTSVSTSTSRGESFESVRHPFAMDLLRKQEATLLPPDIMAMAESMSSQLLISATEPQLLVLMPLVIHRIALEHKANRESDLVLPLRERLHFSRRLKLRFLLLRNLPAFSAMILSLRYVARAYEKPAPVDTSSAIPRLDIFDVPTPHTFKLPVDMVGTKQRFTDFHRFRLYYKCVVFVNLDTKQRKKKKRKLTPLFVCEARYAKR